MTTEFEYLAAPDTPSGLSHYEAASRNLRLLNGTSVNLVTMLAVLIESNLAIHDEILDVAEELRELRLQRERIEEQRPLR